MINDLAQETVDSIELLLESKIKSASFDMTFSGQIQETGLDGSYTVSIAGKSYKGIRSISQYVMSVGDVVLVLLPKANLNNAVILGSVH